MYIGRYYTNERIFNFSNICLKKFNAFFDLHINGIMHSWMNEIEPFTKKVTRELFAQMIVKVFRYELLAINFNINSMRGLKRQW